MEEGPSSILTRPTPGTGYAASPRTVFPPRDFLMSELTQARLKEVLDYCPETGIFVWKRRPEANPRWNGRYPGKPAGGKWVKGRGSYLLIGIDGSQYWAHRLAFLYVLGYLPPKGVDHINGSGMDNRWANLREADDSVNHKNHALRVDSRTRVCGVHFHKASKKYTVRVGHNYVYTYGGLFSTIEEAAIKAKQIYRDLGFAPHHGLTREERANFTAEDLPDS